MVLGGRCGIVVGNRRAVDRRRIAIQIVQLGEAVDAIQETEGLDPGQRIRTVPGRCGADVGDGRRHRVGEPDAVAAEVPAEECGVEAGAAIDGVVALPAGEQVVAGIAVNLVVAASAPQKVTGVIADDRVVAIAEQGVLDHRARADLESLAGKRAGRARIEVERRVAGYCGRVDRVVAGGVIQDPARPVGLHCVFVGVDVGVVGRGRVAIDLERPAVELAGLAGREVIDPERPEARAVLAPEMIAGEHEVDVVCRVAGAAAGVGIDAGPVDQDALCALGRDQHDPQVADPGMADVEVDLDLVDPEILADRDRTGDARRAAVGNGEVGCRAAGACRHVGEGRLPGPGFGEADRGMGVDQAEAVVGAVVQSAAVPIASAIGLPQRAVRADLAGGIGEDLLDVAIAEPGIGLEHQGDDARDRRRRERRAAHVHVVAADIAGRPGGVGGVDADARRGDQDGSAGRAEVRHPPVVVDRGDRRRVDRILEVVEIHVVAEIPVVAGGEYEHRPQAAASGRHRVFEGRLGRYEGARLEVVGEGAGVAPAVVRDVHIRLGADRIHDLAQAAIGAVADAGADDRRVIRDADGADAVVVGRDDAGDGGAMVVAGFRRGIRIARAEIVVCRDVVVGRQVGVAIVEAVVDHADANPAAGVVGPDRSDVEVDAGGAASLARIAQVPLGCDAGITRQVGGVGTPDMSVPVQPFGAEPLFLPHLVLALRGASCLGAAEVGPTASGGKARMSG